MSSPTRDPAEAPGPVFVVSMWRSGSSLLYALLNKHPQVGLMYEADLMLLRSVFWKRRGRPDWAERWQFWNGAFSRHGLNAAEFAENRADFRTAFEAVHRQFATRKGATVWGDKSPNYYDRLREMAEVFPDARFIIVWRDPVDTANSILRAAQSGNSYFKRYGSTLRGLAGNAVFKQQCEWLRGRGRDVLEVNYEDLVRDTASIMRQVCIFLGLEYCNEVATLEGADRRPIYDGQHHALLKGNEIVSGPRPSVVDRHLRSKIDRYVKWWRRKYQGAWPPFHRFEGLDVTEAGWSERAADSLLYRSLRAYDGFTAMCFSHAPLPLLRKYRERKYRKPVQSSIVIAPPESVPVKEA
jgi:LPS sulfotransferase NodH